MKKCPVCDKTFEDSMRFCQTDGTALLDAVEEAVDPFKTMVAPKEDFEAEIPTPAEDPFQTVVAGSDAKEDSGDLLQLPQDYDPMKTSVVSAGELPEIEPDEEIIDIPPPTAPPEPPKFEEPSLSPPSFGDLSGHGDTVSSEGETAIMPPDSFPKFDTSEPGPPAPFSSPTPIPSPFDDAPASYEKPSTSPYQEPEAPPTVMGSSPFDQPAQFGKQESFQQGEWTPPPAPVANWQEQGLGADTPFQPPGATQGQDQTLAIVSLVCGILSICLCGFFTGIPAVITGVMAKNKVDADPAMFGGRGMAIAGIITGVIGSILGVIGVILQIALGGFGRF